ncbi:nicotinate-nucleotide--dimethylbenzimidazole phosphoribosyltransferase [Aquibium carbonis]|uniref:Nicotinate-nucleotide--dimethylbenzimidazole phosphoribosyltransferase n=1 Tax=Aquibium carbonis TaxID=2495581 RepID=A0A429YZ45_9HYPH|nr:nicotinate-nucleotide--dimethylbenzimidazole phosphoribosyltransferase [Aquibium carbonis]RST86684.1 nicotinate-nucleotide--dimethylbenzimidazole phosphoribosyltransferase [Aquibium carbonis]
MTTGLPFDDYRSLLTKLPGPDEAAGAAARRRIERIAPADRLGLLGALAVWLAEWSGRTPPTVNRPQLAVFAGNHGVAPHGAMVQPVSTTAAIVEHCAAGGRPVNQICVASDVGFKVYDLAIDMPTGDIGAEAAMDEKGCAATMAFGMEATAGGMDLLCVGSVGVGGEIAAAAVFAAICGGSGVDWAIGSDGAATQRAALVDQALATHRGHLSDPLEVLRRLGGREMAAIAGAILAARAQKIPVLLDGDQAIAAARLLQAANPAALDHCRLATMPVDAALAKAARQLGLPTVLTLDVDLPEGAAAALAVSTVRAAALCLANVQPLIILEQ